MKRFLKSFLPNKKAKSSSRKVIHVDSKKRDILTALFSLPVNTKWLSDAEIDKINIDATVASAKGSRKASTLKKEVIIECSNETIKEYFEKLFNYELIDTMLDTPYQGFSVFEINWIDDNTPNFFPEIQERNYQEFSFVDGNLMHNATGMATEIPPYKAIHAIYKKKYNKPYGQALNNSLFWLIKFKNASLEFWLELLEKFGTPWVVAKTDGEKDALADEIYAMLGGDGAVLDLEDSLDIKTAQHSGNFKEIIEYIDKQIRSLILGGNLTAEVKGGSQAAATVHNDIREDLATSDENITLYLMREVIEYFKEINYLDIDIKVTLKDKDDSNIALASRDKTIHEMGYIPTQKYIESTYNIKVEPITPALAASKKFAFSNTPHFEDELDSKTVNTQEMELAFYTQIDKIISSSKTYEEAYDKLLSRYIEIDSVTLEDAVFRQIANAQILAQAESEDETEI